jgi:hypothetical protein
MATPASGFRVAGSWLGRGSNVTRAPTAAKRGDSTFHAGDDRLSLALR